VKRALAYVLGNWKKHGLVDPTSPSIDPFSSGRAFDGWSNAQPAPRLDTEPWRPPRPRTWLLGIGWRTRGRLSTLEGPHAKRRITGR
jgi:hypothetical protein